MGMTKKEYEERMRELLFYFVVAPAVILIGMAFTGYIIDALLHTPSTEPVTFAKIFTFIGGTPSICLYYLKLWKEFTRKAELRV
jgi:membrane associated rhomboid family serine protease